jgi:hypothetical protein
MPKSFGSVAQQLADESKIAITLMTFKIITQNFQDVSIMVCSVRQILKKSRQCGLGLSED